MRKPVIKLFITIRDFAQTLTEYGRAGSVEMVEFHL